MPAEDEDAPPVMHADPLAPAHPDREESPWVRLCCARDALREGAGTTVGRFAVLDELRHMETPDGIYVHVDDLMEIARDQARCGTDCRGFACLSSRCTDRRIAAVLAGEVASADARRLLSSDTRRLDRVHGETLRLADVAERGRAS